MSDARDSLAGMAEAGPVSQALHLGMLRRGVASASRLMYCISAPMGPAEVDFAIAALDDCLAELKPNLEREFPGLLA